MQLGKDIWKYACALGSEWVWLLTSTGIAVVVSYALPAIWKSPSPIIFWIISVLAFLPASYRVWKKESKSKELAETALISNRNDKQVILSKKIGQPLQIRFVSSTGLYYTIENGSIQKSDSLGVSVCNDRGSCWITPLADVEILRDGVERETIQVKAPSESEFIPLMLEQWRLWSHAQASEMKFDKAQYLMRQFLAHPEKLLPYINTLKAESREPWEQLSTVLKLEIKKQKDPFTFKEKVERGHEMEKKALIAAQNTGAFNGPKSAGAYGIWDKQVKFVIEYAVSKSEAMDIFGSFKIKSPPDIQAKQTQQIITAIEG